VVLLLLVEALEVRLLLEVVPLEVLRPVRLAPLVVLLVEALEVLLLLEVVVVA
jgi:hypothetical protein